MGFRGGRDIEVYPKDFELGWIFYNNDNDSEYNNEDGSPNTWEVVRQLGVQQLEGMMSELKTQYSGAALQAKMSQYATALSNMAKAERNKENRIMQEALGTDFSTTQGKEFLRHFNEAVIGQEKFAGALKRLMAAIEKGGKLRAPSQASNFAGYFIAAVNEEIKKYPAIQLLESDQVWETIYQDATNTAIHKMVAEFKEDNPIFGAVSDYKGLEEYIKKSGFYDDFVKQYMKLEEVQDYVKEELSKKKQKNRAYTTIKTNQVFKTTTKDGKKKSNELFNRMAAGFVHQYFSAGNMEIQLTDTGAKVSGGNMRSATGATDTETVATWQEEFDIDLNAVSELIQEAATGETQKEIAFRFNRLYERLNRKKFSKLFVIHGSDKLYSMGDSFRSFGKVSKVTDIKDLLNRSGIGSAHFGNKLIALYLNTTKGAALDDKEKTKEIEDAFRVIVAALAGQLLFSDWFMIGYEGGGPTQIHVFDLDGVIIPLSYILEELAKAMEEFGKSGIYNGPLRIGNFTRGEILYPKGQDPRYPGHEAGAKDFNTYWIKQREDARSKAQFRINFLSNFKTLVKQLAKDFQ